MILQEIDSLVNKNLNKNYLYHYNTKKLDVLYTLHKQSDLGKRNITVDEFEKMKNRDDFTQREYPYWDHISFFVDPIPLDIVRKHFTKNKVYQGSDCLYEHRINTQQLKNHLLHYMFVETSIDQFMADIWIRPHFPGKSLLYFTPRNLISKLLNYQGEDFEKLIQVIQKFKGKTEQAFIDLVKSDRFDDDHKRSYAASIPHLFIYPKNGEVKIEKVTKRCFE
jgi:hypothetical protein